MTSVYDSLKTFYCAQFRFNLKAIDEIRLPPYKGFALRGVFGAALKELVCTQGVPSTCKGCSRTGSCAYIYLFETAPDADTLDAGKFNNYPRPYVIVPPLDGRQSYSPEERFDFTFVLVGKALEYLPHIIMAFDQVGRQGFGRKIERGTQGRFNLEIVEEVGVDGRSRLIYSNGVFSGTSRGIFFKDLSRELVPCSRLAIIFLTPLRVESHGKPVTSEPEFSFLIESIGHRAMLLNQFHCGGEGVGTLCLHQTHSVCIDSTDVRWVEIKRYSNRQNNKLKFSGLMGSIVYSGIGMEEYLPLLRLGELLHMGKSTTFGLGQFRLLVS